MIDYLVPFVVLASAVIIMLYFVLKLGRYTDARLLWLEFKASCAGPGSSVSEGILSFVRNVFCFIFVNVFCT